MSVKVPLLDLRAQYAPLRDEVLAATDLGGAACDLALFFASGHYAACFNSDKVAEAYHG